MCMKKLFISMIMLVLLLPMGAPATIAYKAVVIKSEGVDYYDYSGSYTKAGHLDKDKEVTVYYDTVDKSGTYLYACFDNEQSKCY